MWDQSIRFFPDPRSHTQVPTLSFYTKEKWGDVMRGELIGIFDSDTFSLIEEPLPFKEILPTKLALKTKLNSHFLDTQDK